MAQDTSTDNDSSRLGQGHGTGYIMRQGQDTAGPGPDVGRDMVVTDVGRDTDIGRDMDVTDIDVNTAATWTSVRARMSRMSA